MDYQYTLLVKRKEGKPYHINVYDYLDLALSHLEEEIKKDKHYKRIYYVANDFYKNEYSEDMATSKYKLLVREVGDWKPFRNIYDYIKRDVDNDVLM